MGVFDGGGSVFQFIEPGDEVTGTVISFEEKQQMTYDHKEKKRTNVPAFYPNSQDPIMEVVFTLDTDIRDDDQDDGRRYVYVSSTRAKKTLVKAVRDSGSKVPEQGGTLRVKYVGKDPASFEGKAKIFEIAYAKPEVRSATFGTGQPAQAAPAAQPVAQPPQQDPWAPAQADVLTAEQRSKLSQLDAIPGLDDATVAAALGVTVAVLHQARGDEVI